MAEEMLVKVNYFVTSGAAFYIIYSLYKFLGLVFVGL